MKITQDKPVFQTVTIVLENEDDYRIFRELLRGRFTDIQTQEFAQFMIDQLEASHKATCKHIARD